MMPSKPRVESLQCRNYRVRMSKVETDKAHALEQECKDILLDCQFNNKAPTGEHLKKLLKWQGIDISRFRVENTREGILKL